MFAVEYPLLACTAIDATAMEEETEAPSSSLDATAALDSVHPSLFDVHKQLQNEKERVRVAIQTFGDEKWRSAVFQPQPNWSTVPRTRPCSRAYYKLWEMVRASIYTSPATFFFICEAPGGFIEACMDLFGGDGIDWYAISKVGANRFASHLSKKRMLHFEDNDVTRSSVRDSVVARLQDRGADFITADGAAEMDHSNLEVESLALVEAEVDLALRVCNEGGTFVLKFFEGCTSAMLALLARLCASFNECSLYKPTHSRPTNSERYVICQGFVCDAGVVLRPDDAWVDDTTKTIAMLCTNQAQCLKRALLKLRD